MRPVRLNLEGFRRLADTECDITPRILAFVGQNEAGKSSLLAALAWATEEGVTPLAREDQSRANRKNSGWIVGVTFQLSDEDKATLADLEFATTPTRFALWKQADGTLHHSLPGDPPRNPERFRSARALLAASVGSPTLEWEAESEGEAPRSWATSVLQCLEDPDHEWSDDETGDLDKLCHWLSSPAEAEGDGAPGEEVQPQPAKDASTADALRVVLELSHKHPRDQAIEILKARVPRFVEFEESFRALPTHTPFDAKGRLSGREPSIANLLRIARISLPALEQASRVSDVGQIETIVDAGNRRLLEFFSQAWNQSGVCVRFRLKESGLECLIHETEHGSFTNLEERSDGLRAFIALAAFIEAQALDIPPVLLIDEAETHLHIDAQADLVSVLLGQLNVTQVLYTTHSPGCLPSDLGTGIRLVARDSQAPNTSVLRSDFWTNTSAGYSPLLYAMGASAAAFSACRYAVLAEGPSEMVLLPTLLRQAAGKDDLQYQVVQGLAQATIGEDRLDEVAAKVMYLVDGDKQGVSYRRQLVKSGVDANRIQQLPNGWALEDLFEPQYVIEKLAGLRAMARQPDPVSLSGDGPIMTRLQAWARTQEPPVLLAGKTALAYSIVEDQDRKLKPEAVQALEHLHRAFQDGFSPTPADKKPRATT